MGYGMSMLSFLLSRLLESRLLEQHCLHLFYLLGRICVLSGSGYERRLLILKQKMIDYLFSTHYNDEICRALFFLIEQSCKRAIFILNKLAANEWGSGDVE